MLDQTKYEYIEVELPNIFVVWEIGKDKTDAMFGIDKDIKEFVVQAAMKFPMWRFVSASISRRKIEGTNGMLHEAYRFNVYEDREKIGEISTDYSRAHGRVYCITNQRISQARERGRAAKTKDLNKAIKLLAKNFGVKTVQERLAEANGHCQTAIGLVYREKSERFRDGYKELANKLITHLMTNWDITKQLAKDSGVDPALIDDLPAKFEDYEIAREVYKCYDTDKGAVVTIHGNDYAVKEGKSITIYGTENLPEWLKRGVGMLKLVEPQHLIGKVGIKINQQSFFVMKGTENE